MKVGVASVAGNGQVRAALLKAFIVALCFSFAALIGSSHVVDPWGFFVLGLAAATCAFPFIVALQRCTGGLAKGAVGWLAGLAIAALGGTAIACALVPSLRTLPFSVLALGDVLALMVSAASVRRSSGRRETGVAGIKPTAAVTLLVGSGDSAKSFISLTARKNLGLRVVGCVDDEPFSKRVAGVPVVGRIADLPSLIARHRIEAVIVTVTNASEDLIRRVQAACAPKESSAGPVALVKVLPGVGALLDAGYHHRRNGSIALDPEEVLPRAVHHIDMSFVQPHIRNQSVLVTGAGGSIGSEISRQVADLGPRELIILGHGENSLFALEQELRNERGFHAVRLALADIVDAAAVRAVFSKYRPNIVFHAAAHKHVPILEGAPCQAVQNNIIGTNNVALAAAASGVAKFILLSTDKAVNPTSVMGATKRVAELICQSFAHRTATEFVVVRFGNVLGSRGSVLPTFCRQVQQGGPVTITHRDMERFFMTIPEAVSLVLQAMALGRDGQVFVLDMGKPVKILELAEKVIRLSGYIPHSEIKIIEIGVRPGEKLFEETLTSREGLTRTSHERLYIAQQERIEYDVLADYVRRLADAVRLADWKTNVRLLAEIVPSYTPDQRLRDALVSSIPRTIPTVVEEFDIAGDELLRRTVGAHP